jgi:hypothetical protein
MPGRAEPQDEADPAIRRAMRLMRQKALRRAMSVPKTVSRRRMPRLHSTEYDGCHATSS